MDSPLGALLGLGFVLGVRHAMDADHLAAVSALVARHRSVARSCLIGAVWGAGHTAALMAAGVAVIVFRLSISPALERSLELIVALMLVGLGGHVLLRVLAGSPAAGHAHPPAGGAGLRPFVVGIVHGLAGSAALTLLVLSATPASVGAGLAYILVFGIGSTGGMLVLSGLLSIPFALTAGRTGRAQQATQAVAGALSLLIGLAMVYQLQGA
jgi:high-affinity nickel-transport protein